jgi:hypothetical protein
MAKSSVRILVVTTEILFGNVPYASQNRCRSEQFPEEEKHYFIEDDNYDEHSEDSGDDFYPITCTEIL